jgi:hypothetical protein
MLTRCPSQSACRYGKLDRASDHRRLRLDNRGSHEYAPTVERDKVMQEPEDSLRDPDPDGGVDPGLGDRPVVPGSREDERGADDMKGEEDLVRSPAQPFELTRRKTRACPGQQRASVGWSPTAGSHFDRMGSNLTTMPHLK